MNFLISFLQTFAIILVVMGHAGESIPYLTKWIYSFHMPLFIFISGFLLKETNPKIKNINFILFFNKKIKRLLIPYIVISSCAYIPKFILNSFAMRPLNLSFKSFIDGLIFPWQNPIIFFWFLPTIFIILCLTVLFFKINQIFKTPLFSYLCFSLIFLLHFINFPNLSLFNIKGVINYSLFFILGILYNINQKKIDSIFCLDNIFVTTFLFLISCSNLFFNFNNKFTLFLYTISGILFSISLGKLYLKYDFHFFNHLYGTSFTIYLFSWFPQVFIRIIFLQIFKFNWPIVLFLSTFFGIYIPVYIFYFMKKPFLKNKKLLQTIFGL